VGRSFLICRIAGVPVKLHWAYFLVPIYFLWAPFLDVGVHPAGLLHGSIDVLLLSAAILAHELAHALTARSFHARVHSITLWALGGLTEVSQMPPAASAKILLSLSGPACTFALAGLGHALSGQPGAVGEHMQFFAFWNFWIGVLNLVPAYPLDGSQALRAALRARLGEARGDLVTARVGIIAGVGIILAGLAWGTTILVIIGIMAVAFSYDLLRQNRFAGYSAQPRVPPSGDFRTWRLPKKELDAEIKRKRTIERANREMRRKVDELLKQISEKGIESLSDEDRAFLHAASERLRGQGR